VGHVPAVAESSDRSLDHLSVMDRDRAAIPTAVYDKAKSDGVVQEKLGPDALRLHLKPLWPEDRPHLPIAEIKLWFSDPLRKLCRRLASGQAPASLSAGGQLRSM
jgi:hypothetical protein